MEQKALYHWNKITLIAVKFNLSIIMIIINIEESGFGLNYYYAAKLIQNITFNPLYK